MARHLSLLITEPCKESWNEMVQKTDGRYCLSCQKTVVDFTHMSDGELIAYFKNHKGNTCGRFTQSQLDRDIPIPSKPIPYIKYFFQFTLPAFLISLKSAGQGSKPSTLIEIAPSASKSATADTTQTPVVIKGFVTDDSENALQGASVYVKGTSRGCITDEKGSFTLFSISVPATLQFSYVGFQMKEIAVGVAQSQVEIKLSLEPEIMKEVITAGYVVTAIKPKRKAHKLEAKQQTKASEPSVLAYPNPVISGSQLNIHCRSLERGTYIAELFTLSGQLVHTSKSTYGKGDSMIAFQLNHLPSGTYLLKLTNEKNRKYTSQQVIVQN